MKELEGLKGRGAFAVFLVVLVALGVLLASPARGADAQTAAPDTCDDTQDGCSAQAFWRYSKNPNTGVYDIRGNYDEGAYATFTFAGTSVKWITVKSPIAGKAVVYLDGRKVKTFDGYSSAVKLDQVGYAKTGLAKKKHTLKLVSSGKNPSSTGNGMFIDQFNVGSKAYQQTDYLITYGEYEGATYGGAWKGVANSSAFGKSYRESSSVGMPASFFTYGSEIGVKTAVGPKYGEMYVDVYQYDDPASENATYVGSTILDNYAPSLAFETKEIVPVNDEGQEQTLDPNKVYTVDAYSNVGEPVAVDGWVGDLTPNGTQNIVANPSGIPTLASPQRHDRS